jgi:hypothetical protein
MIDMRYKPRFLPQVHAPYDVVLQKLDDEGVNYTNVEVDPNELTPLQGITFSDDVGGVNVDDMNPIWISSDMQVLDGHHRMVRALLDEIPIKCIKIDMNHKDACRVLNKIQDIYEYEQSQGIEEVQDQDAINFYQDDQNQFLNSLEEDNIASQDEENPNKNQKTVVAYRKAPIKENSVVGNFFTLEQVGGYDTYEIDFDNLLDTNSLGIAYKDGQEPVDILAKSWFPNVNFEKISKQYNVPSINLKNKAVAEKAIKMGYDGIKYGDKIIQGLK